MAKTCPKCNRPNNDRAERCLYCSAPLAVQPAPEAPAREQSIKAPEQSPRAADRPSRAPSAKKPRVREVYLVVVSPDQDLSGANLSQFADMLNLDEYTARHKLKLPAPWTARAFPEPGPAQQAASAFAGLGIDAYVVKQSGIDKVTARQQAAGLRSIDGDGIVFLAQDGSETRLDFADVSLIVRGRIRERRERGQEVEEGGPPVRLGKMALGREAGGSGAGKVARQAVEQFRWKPRLGLFRMVLRGTTLEIADIYRKSSHRSIRIVETEFDYSGLGERMSPSSLLNFNFLLSAVREGAPEAVEDKTFNLVGYTMTEVPKEDKVRAELASVLGTSEGTQRIYDNRFLFDEYSARLYLHRLRRRSMAAGAAQPPAR